MSINMVCVSGNVTRTPEGLTFLPNGTAKLEFSIAVNRSVKKGDEWESVASFFDVVTFGKKAENIKTYISKGVKVVVSGGLRQDRWQGQDGKTRSKIYITADEVVFPNGGNGSNVSASEGFSRDEVQKVADEFGDGGFPEDVPF